jgi:hypothetical protein
MLERIKYITSLIQHIGKTWPLALHECYHTTSSIRFLHTSCFLALPCPLLFSLLFIVLTSHLTLHGKVSGVFMLRHSTGT